MQADTGCKINVSQASGADIEREIGLVGTRQAIDDAKRAIWDKVDQVVSNSGQLSLITSLISRRRRRTQAAAVEVAAATVAVTMATTVTATHNSNPAMDKALHNQLPLLSQPKVTQQLTHTPRMAATRIT